MSARWIAPPHARRAPCLFRNASDHLDLEIETRQPGHADRRPVGIGRRAEDPVLDGHDGRELVFGIGVECGDVDDIGEGAAGCFQRRLQVVEGQLDLACEVRFGRSVGPAADLSGDEEKVAGADRG
jgi:hypothetical protein